MSSPTQLYNQLFKILSQYSFYKDLRHLKALAWMIQALLLSGKINLSEWEPYIQCRATQAQSVERRCQRFLNNRKIKVRTLYIPLMLAAISNWQTTKRIYLAIDTTVLWNRFCMIHVSIVCGRRAIPFLWKVIEHKSATVTFAEYKPLLKIAQKLIEPRFSDVMLLADRGFANHQLIQWLQESSWHYSLRLPCDVMIHGARRHPIELKYLVPPVSEAVLFHHVGLWSDGKYLCNLVLANVRGVKESWGVRGRMLSSPSYGRSARMRCTDEEPSLNTLWQYGMRFRVEQLFLDSKSGVFQLEESRIRTAKALARLYLIVALALLFATVHGMTIQVQGLRRQVDPHWRRGLSYLKIGLRWLKGFLHKSRDLLSPLPLLSGDPEPCFASKKAEADYYDEIWFSRIRSLDCRT